MPYVTKKTSLNRLAVANSFKNFLKGFEGDCDVCKLVLAALKIKRYQNPNLNFNYISIRSDDSGSMVAYMPNNRTQEINENGQWSRKGRQETRPGRFVRAILHPRLLKKVTDKMLNEFSTRFKVFDISSKYEFEIVDFKTGYDGSKYLRNIHSCMAGKPVHTFYEQFPCRVLVLKSKEDNNMFVGRAIIWDDVFLKGQEKPIKFMDRIYTGDSPTLTQLFKEWAQDNGYYHKSFQNSKETEDIVSPENEIIECPHLYVERKKDAKSIKSRRFNPYLDTFSIKDHGTKKLSNCYDVQGPKTVYLLKNADNTVDKSKIVYAYYDKDQPKQLVAKPHTIKIGNRLYNRYSPLVYSYCDYLEVATKYGLKNRSSFIFHSHHYPISKFVVVKDMLFLKKDPRLERKESKYILKDDWMVNSGLKDCQLDEWFYMANNRAVYRRLYEEKRNEKSPIVKSFFVSSNGSVNGSGTVVEQFNIPVNNQEPYIGDGPADVIPANQLTNIGVTPVQPGLNNPFENTQNAIAFRNRFRVNFIPPLPQPPVEISRHSTAIPHTTTREIRENFTVIREEDHSDLIDTMSNLLAEYDNTSIIPNQEYSVSNTPDNAIDLEVESAFQRLAGRNITNQ